jgi:polyadenylation factor subunit 2
VNCCQWNINGNWLASGSTDGLIKIYDIRVMKEMETLRGQNSEVSLSRVSFPVFEG